MADNKVEKAEEIIEKDTKVDEVDKDKEEDTKSETPEKVKNGEAVVETEENGKPEDETTEKVEAEEEPEDKTCSVKRKSTGGGDAPDGKPAEGVTPEKKQKLDEPASELEAKGEAEVAA